MFKRSLNLLLAIFLASGAAQAAESPFVGAWTLDPSRTRLPDEMKVQAKGGNTYEFDFGGTAETIVLDGSDQKGEGGTLLSVKPEAPDTWIVERKQAGRLLLRATWKLSSGGRTLKDYFRQFRPDGTTFSVDYVYRRSSDGSGFAADWKSVRETMNSPFRIEVKAFEGDGLSFVNTSTHVTKNMKFDGRDYRVEGPNAPRGASASLRRLDARNLVITDKVDGTVAVTEDVGLSPDLKTLTIAQHIAGRDRANVLVLKRT